MSEKPTEEQQKSFDKVVRLMREAFKIKRKRVKADPK